MKFLTLLLQVSVYYLSRVDRDRVKDDARKFGITLIGAGFLGVALGQMSLSTALVIFTIGVTVWLYGIAK